MGRREVGGRGQPRGTEATRGTESGHQRGAAGVLVVPTASAANRPVLSAVSHTVSASKAAEILRKTPRFTASWFFATAN